MKAARLYQVGTPLKVEEVSEPTLKVPGDLLRMIQAGTLNVKAIKTHVFAIDVASDDESARKTVMALAQDIGFAPIDCGKLRNARMIEGIGDFIRFLMIGQLQTPYAAISVNVLPTPSQVRLGGRQPSNLS